VTSGFHTYIYTNCRADEGLQQRDGFQFQAISPGANPSAMPLVQRRLLYEPAPQWMRERRAVSQYPPSFAHVFADNIYATAAGVYVGREATGGREGNQLTHAIATEDPGAYRLIRPAQLFGAPFWTTVPAPAQQCPALEPGWQPGPFGVTEAQRFVRAQNHGAALLTALLSHLRRGDADPRRVLFVAREPELVLRWVTAATLLVPHRQALRIDFKIFTLNPAYADHRILAVHPDWSTGAASLDNQLGYVVFDLVQHRWTAVPADPDSERWVQLFLREDPYDVVDAVEVAAEVAAANARVGPARTAFALAVVLGRPPEPEAVAPIIEWLATSPRPLVDRYGETVVDQLLVNADRWTADELNQFDRAVRGSVPGRAATVRLSLLRAEIREVTGQGRVRTGLLPRLAAPIWDETAEAAATDLFYELMRQAPPDRFELLLRLARRFGVGLARFPPEPGLQRFVEHWAQHPELEYDTGAWADGDEIEEKLRTLLNRRLGADPDPVVAQQLGDAWWRALLTQPADLLTPLDRAIVSAAMTELEDEPRAGFVRAMLESTRQDPEPLAAFRRLAGTLWLREAPTILEARRLAALMPKRLVFGSSFFPTLSAGLLRAKVDDRHFRAAYVLAEDRKVWQPIPSVQARIDQEAGVRFVIVQLAKEVPDSRRIGEVMRRVAAPTVLSHHRKLLDAMVRAPLAAAVLAVLEAAPQLLVPYTRQVTLEVTSEIWHPAQMTMAFVVSEMGPGVGADEADGQVLERLNRALTDFLVRASGSRLEEVGHQIQRLDDPWPEKWTKYLRSVRPRGAIGRIIRRE
jgi:hypothetical protein